MKTKLLSLGIALGWLTQAAMAEQPAPSATTTSSRAFLASRLIGKDVKSTHGQDLGSIRDVVFNPQTGETFIAIGMGRRVAAPIPWSLMNVGAGADEKYVTANVTKEVLGSAPTVDEKQWGNLNDPKFTQRIYAYFGVPPATAVGAPGKALEGTGTGTEKSEPQKEPETPSKPETGKP